MSQTVVTNFYTTRKRFKDPGKSLKNVEQQNLTETFNKDSALTVIDPPKEKVAKIKGKQVNKVTNYLKPQPKNSKTKSKVDAPPDKAEIPVTPKRNLSSPDELTPSKKKPLVLQEARVSQDITPGKQKSSDHLTPKKLDLNARKKLQLGSPNRFVSPRKIASPLKKEVSPQKAATYENISSKNLASLLNESRSKILFSGKIDELKKSLEKFSKVSTKTKEFQSNSYKITSVISSAKKNDDTPKPVLQGEYKNYTYLAAPDSHSFTLPYKYKLLTETFRCMDTVVSMLNNRKEKITYEKVKNGVQKMMSKNFLKSHLGQIVTVYPSAYSLQYERNDSYVRNNKDSLPFELIITPVLPDDNDNTLTELPSNKSKKNIRSSFTHMSPQHLVDRKNEFLHNITNIVKKHHKDFLTRLNIAIPSDNDIVRWHLKFQVDGVPDIQVAELPEEPETKVYSAKDVLNKIRGSVRGTRVEKALQSVADKSKTETKVEGSQAKEDLPKNNSLNTKQNKALNGVCSELLAKIRAREQAKLMENMTRSVHDEKRSAMLERLPKIVHILWHYFIAERKAAVQVDAAIDKIIHSFNSLTTPEEVKQHLQLITETMPGWLSFIKITKGEYITMDKKKDINEMIANIK